MVQSIDSLGEFKTVIASDTAVVVAFTTDSLKSFEAFEGQFPHIGFFTVDMDKQSVIVQDIADRLQASVHGVPTFYFFRNGEPIDGVFGAYANQLKRLLAHHHPAA
ncbi:hypothetical protein JCM10207_007962 [Rhodosporidiobolus poonsookiae]